MTDVTEAELLGRMSRQLTHPSAAHAAWGELYERHVRYVYYVLRRSFGSILRNQDDLTDLTVDTFRKAFEWAGRQGSAAQVEARFCDEDPDVSRRRVLGWLGLIAERLVRDKLRTTHAPAEELNPTLDDTLRITGRHVSPPTHVIDRVRRALEELKPEDAEALRASLPWYDVERGLFALPAGEAAEIARRLGVSADAFRQRRHRALKLLAEQFAQAEPMTTRKGEV